MPKKSDKPKKPAGTGGRPREGSGSNVIPFPHGNGASAVAASTGPDQTGLEERKGQKAGAPVWEEEPEQERLSRYRAELEFNFQQILNGGPFQGVLWQIMDPSFWKCFRKGPASSLKRGALYSDKIRRILVCGFALKKLESGTQSGPIHWDNRVELWGAYDDLVRFGAGEETEDDYVIRTHALLCFALERYLEAQGSVAKLKKLGQLEGGVSRLLKAIPNTLAYSAFPHSYIVRYLSLNDFFSATADKLISAIEEDPDSGDADTLMESLQDFFLAHTGLLATFDIDEIAAARKAGKKAPMFVTSLDLELDMLPIEFMISSLQDYHSEDWDMHIGRPPLALSRLFTLFREETPGDAFRIRAADSPDHQGIDVQIYHRFLKELDTDGTPDGKLIAEFLMRQLTGAVLGDLNAAVWIHSLTVSHTVFQRRSSHSLLELPQILQDLGYSKKADIADLENKVRRIYTRTPSAPGGLFRADITSGWTDCWRLQDEYDRGEQDAYTHFLNMGVAASFVVWPKSIMKGSSLEDFVDDLNSSLKKSEARNAYSIIGEAEGTEYCYLDLLMYMSPVMVQALEGFFEEIPNGRLARIQPFCCHFPPLPISVYNGFIRDPDSDSAYEPASESASSRTPGTAGGSPGSGPAKKKQSAGASPKTAASRSQPVSGNDAGAKDTAGPAGSVWKRRAPSKAAGELPISAQEERVQYLFKRLYLQSPDLDVPRLLFGNGSRTPQERQVPEDRFKDKFGISKVQALNTAADILQPGLHQRPVHWDNLSEVARAYRLLLAIGAENEAESEAVLTNHAIACFAMEHYPEAQQSFDKLHSKGAHYAATFIDAFEDITLAALNFPLFMNNYISRFNSAWAAFEQPATDLLNAWKRAPRSDDFPRRFQELAQVFLDHLELNAFVHLSSSAQKPTLCFSSPNLDLDIFAIDFACYLMEVQVPEDTVWKPQVGRPPLKPEELSKPFLGIRLETVRLSAADSPNCKGADVQLYHETLAALHQNPSTQIAAEYLAHTLVSLVLGDLAAAVNVRSLTILDNIPSPGTSFSLLELPQRLQLMGYRSTVSSEDLRQKLHFNVVRLGRSSSKRLRDDITSGWTECLRLQDQYERSLQGAFIHYLNMGICACFIAWPNSIVRGDPDAFTEKLTDYMDSTDAFDAFHVIGEFRGTEYHYLDLLIFSVPPVVGALEEFFRSVPGGDRALMQGFCFSSAPGPVRKPSLYKPIGPKAEPTAPAPTASKPAAATAGFKPTTKGFSSPQSKGKKKKKNGKKRK